MEIVNAFKICIYSILSLSSVSLTCFLASSSLAFLIPIPFLKYRDSASVLLDLFKCK